MKTAEVDASMRADYPRLFEILEEGEERYTLRDEVENALREIHNARQFIHDSYRSTP